MGIIVRLAVLVVVAVVAAACNSATDTANEDLGAVASTTTTASVEITPASSTTQPAPAPTQPAITTTTIDPVQLAVRALVGTWSGSWNNTTFGSTGPFDLTITPDGTNIDITSDLGGFVFGQGDPDPESYSFDLATLAGSVGQAVSVDSETFGPLSITLVSAATIEIEALSVPAPGIATLRASATVQPGLISGTYDIEFDGGDTAAGTFEISTTS